MAVILSIASLTQTTRVVKESFALEKTLDGRPTCRFLALDRGRDWQPDIGDPVVVQDGAYKPFGGTIDDIVETRIGNRAAARRQYDIRCVGFDQIFDRHLVTAAYASATCKTIIDDIVATALAGEGITTTGVDTGPTLTQAIFSYDSVTDAFEAIGELAGYTRYVDADKVLYFKPRGGLVAPFTVDTTADDSHCTQLSLRRHRDQYRNKQYLRGGIDFTDPRVETSLGNGATRAFGTVYPIGKAPTIHVNSVSKTVGILGVESGKQWYWNKGVGTLSQDTGETALATTDTLAVTYQGMFPLVQGSQLDTEITARIAAEGGSGLYESVESDGRIEGAAAGAEKLNALLLRYGALPNDLTVITRDAGLDVGQLLYVKAPEFGLATFSDFLIRSVQAAWLPTGKLEYTAEALSGAAVGGWVTFLRRLAERTSYSLSTNEYAALLRTLPEGVQCGDALAASSAAPESRIGFGMIGFSEVAA